MGEDWDDLTAVAKSRRGTLQAMVSASGKPKFNRPAPAFDLSADSNRSMEMWHGAWLTEAYRVLQPGGTVSAFGGSRTFHRLGSAMERVGFVEVRIDAWGYATGFPKAHSVSVLLDKRQGLTRPVIGERRNKGIASGHGNYVGGESPLSTRITSHASADAQTWDGWRTALKPAWEPVLVGVKPG